MLESHQKFLDTQHKTKCVQVFFTKVNYPIFQSNYSPQVFLLQYTVKSTIVLVAYVVLKVKTIFRKTWDLGLHLGQCAGVSIMVNGAVQPTHLLRFWLSRSPEHDFD